MKYEDDVIEVEVERMATDDYSEEIVFQVQENDDEEIEYLDDASDEITEPESEEEFEIKSESENELEASAVPREEIKYEKIKPMLVLTPDFLKAREALKSKQKESIDQPEFSAYFAETLIFGAEEKVVYICAYPGCKFEFQSVEEMNLHRVDHKRKSESFQCDYCPMVFKARHNYDKHVKLAHGELQYICQFCGKTFDTRVQWRSHLRNHDQTQRFKCPHEGCNKAFRVKHHLNNHLRVHSKDSPFACTFDKCTARFRQKHALTIHVRKHTGDFISCEVCKSPFVTQFQLNKHLMKCDGTYKKLLTRSVPRNSKTSESVDYFKCSVEGCLEDFKAKITLEKHLAKTHLIEVTPTMCTQCLRDFESQRDLKSHMRDHLPFTCLLCGCGFKSEETYQTHLKKIHEKEETRVHHCAECTASFKRADHLRTHIAYKHRKERPFACDFCSYLSATRYDLNAHMKIHLSKFSCQFCDFKTTLQIAIDSHVQTSHKSDFLVGMM